MGQFDDGHQQKEVTHNGTRTMGKCSLHLCLKIDSLTNKPRALPSSLRALIESWADVSGSTIKVCKDPLEQKGATAHSSSPGGKKKQCLDPIVRNMFLET